MKVSDLEWDLIKGATIRVYYIDKNKDRQYDDVVIEGLEAFIQEIADEGGQITGSDTYDLPEF